MGYTGRKVTIAWRVFVLALMACVLVLGWQEFLFLTDDAYITFRYIDHYRRGWGYVWNPPPFRPVEGYSNFLWMILLHGAWNVTGLDPTRTANVFSLVASFGSLALAFSITWHLDWPARLQRHRFALSTCVLAFGLTNRAFLTWTSSGLETALFGFCTLLWVLSTLRSGSSDAQRWRVLMSCGAASAALTRPDGVLMVLAAIFVLAVEVAYGRSIKRALLAAVPLASVPVHLLWRRSYYGEWLPNTYYAKHVRIWPDAGVRYLESFVLEHALWTWALLALVVAALQYRRIEREGLAPGAIRGWLAPSVIIATLAAHVAYYVLIVGGDHFEYRILAHLVLPLGIGLVALVIRLHTSPALTYGVMAGVIIPGLFIPWVHHARSRVLVTREQTYRHGVPVADVFPRGPLRSYALAYDRLQAWLLLHHVGTRRQEHKVFAEFEAATFPTREEGEKITWKERGVTPAASVGLVGWVLPEVAVIDVMGLNDWVVARHPAPDDRFRALAHERYAPPGYVECFKPNVEMDYNKGVRWKPRASPLTDVEIIGCEDHFMAESKKWAEK